MAHIREPLRLSRLDLIWGSVAGLLIEALTCVLRFAVRLQSTRDTTFIGRFTFGYRVHHGYIGLIAMAARSVRSCAIGSAAGRSGPVWHCCSRT